MLTQLVADSFMLNYHTFLERLLQSGLLICHTDNTSINTVILTYHAYLDRLLQAALLLCHADTASS